MTNQLNITITKRLQRIVGLGLSAALLVLAHGGFDHVMGTVVQVTKNVMTVKTAKGNVEVKLDEKTELTKNGQKAQAADLTPGTRVVVDIPEGGPAGSKDKIAHSVKMGTVAKTAEPHAHEAH
jgi:hypothetical protein